MPLSAANERARRRRDGRASVLLIVALAVIAALLAVPLHHLTGGVLVLAVTGVCIAWLVGAQSLADRILPWAIGLAAVTVVWPIAINTFSVMREGMVSMPFRAPVEGGLNGVLFDVGTCAMLGGLVILASGVLLISSKIRASLPPSRPAPRPQARRRARVVEPGNDDTINEGTVGRRQGGGNDDFGLMGGGDGR